jgi:hypothetical protein
MKTKFAYLPVLALSLFSASAFAALLQGELSGKNLENQPLLKSASIQAADSRNGTLQVTAVGAALRQKKKLGVNFKVYVGQLLVSEPEKLDRAADKALDSLKGLKAVAIQMTFLRGVSSGDMVTAFTDGFNSNGISLEDPIVKQILEFTTASGDLEAGKTLTFVGELGASTEPATELAASEETKEHIIIENTKGEIKTITGGAGSIRTAFALWLGTLPAKDEGLLKFKSELLLAR